jgi:enamine deaminase RidA (YjgF/YER057c/UK114 family)
MTLRSQGSVTGQRMPLVSRSSEDSALGNAKRRILTEAAIMDNITAILAAHGATLADVVNIRAYLTDMSRRSRP